MKLYGLKNGEEVIVHIHDGNGHTFCGIADDLFESYKAGNHLTCKECRTLVLEVLRIAKKYNIK